MFLRKYQIYIHSDTCDIVKTENKAQKITKLRNKHKITIFCLNRCKKKSPGNFAPDRKDLRQKSRSRKLALSVALGIPGI